MAKKIQTKSEDLKEGKEIKWIFIALAVLALVFIVSSLIFGFLKETAAIKYAGFTFDKQNVGNITFYHTTLSVMDYNRNLHNYNLYLRNDPRKNNVPVQGNDFRIVLGMPVYLGLDKDVPKCKDNTLAIHLLSEFLTYNNYFINLKIGATDNESATSANLSLINCEQNVDNTVVVLTPGNETKVTKTASGCYVINYANCEIVKASERFVLGLLENSTKLS